MEKTHKTNSAEETQKLGENFAKEILTAKNNGAIIIALRGNLGGGKTTFLQGFAKGLGTKEKILSPTFLILKKFEIRNSKSETNNFFYHIDCYRINNPEEILELGWEEIIKNPKNIVAVEWPEKIEKFLPKETINLEFKFINENQREIIWKTKD